ncbi:hypothetical protein [Cytobacillus dafuensis]|uniref:Type 4 fimbrial biogenesis protein PilX N-terminal domain-containing protein n=1 Tax=Cytobacillus dafuensis TaxID=1742359 RepID=A0A5B8ZBF0_CYTDA|nr:hypothetical protein [Cytobacillus dafuensis]QED48806.1 hypothetical protein FSZ17_16955 [Cytobacillus dafuensis]
MKNEKGSSLIVVLLIITLISVFSLVIMSSTVNSRLQFNSTEKTNVSTDIAEMGITHYYTLFKKLAKEAYSDADTETIDWVKKYSKNNKSKDEPTQQEIIDYFNEQFCSNLLNYQEVKINYESIFPIENEKYQLYVTNSPSETACAKTLNTLEFTFTSIGEFEKQKKELTGTITMNKGNEINDPAPSHPPDSNHFKYIVNNKIYNKYYDGSVYFKERIDMNGNSKELVINGDAYFAKGLVLNGNVTLKINGNAYFLDVRKNGSSGNICVTGQTFKIQDSTLIPYPLPGNSCSSNNDKWDPDSLNIDVEYN